MDALKADLACLEKQHAELIQLAIDTDVNTRSALAAVVEATKPYHEACVAENEASLAMAELCTLRVRCLAQMTSFEAFDTSEGELAKVIACACAAAKKRVQTAEARTRAAKAYDMCVDEEDAVLAKVADSFRALDKIRARVKMQQELDDMDQERRRAEAWNPEVPPPSRAGGEAEFTFVLRRRYLELLESRKRVLLSEMEKGE